HPRPEPSPSGAGSPGPDPPASKPPASTRTGQAVTVTAGRRLAGSAAGAAGLTSLLDGLRPAQPHDPHGMLDGAAYEGPFVIDGPYRLEGVRLISKAGATLRAGTDHGRMAILIVDGVRRVRVEGFRIVGAGFVHTVALRGNVAGATLSQLHIVQPAD